MAIVDFETVQAIEAAIYAFAIHTLFGLIGIDQEIAVFQIAGVIAEVGIFHSAFQICQAEMGSFITEFEKLIEERAGEVEMGFAHGFPIVAPPAVQAVDWKLRVCAVH